MVHGSDFGGPLGGPIHQLYLGQVDFRNLYVVYLMQLLKSFGVAECLMQKLVAFQLWGRHIHIYIYIYVYTHLYTPKYLLSCYVKHGVLPTMCSTIGWSCQKCGVPAKSDIPSLSFARMFVQGIFQKPLPESQHGSRILPRPTSL